jgi:hypothetical protein
MKMQKSRLVQWQWQWQWQWRWLRSAIGVPVIGPISLTS